MTRRLLLIFILILATVITFARAIPNQFVGWDDPETIVSNPRLNPPTLANLRHFWTHSESGLYVPITYTLWSGLARIAPSPDPRAFHIASLTIHTLSVLLVFTILRTLTPSANLRSQISNPKDPSPTPLPAYRERDLSAAFFGAILFAIHPLQVESVAWASGAKDLLGGLFSLIVIDQYVRYAKARDQRAKLHYALALIALIFGLLSKPIAVVAPLIAGILAVGILCRPVRATLRSLAPMFLLSLACIIWSRIVQPAYDATWTPLWTRPLIAADAIAFYLCKLFVPIDLIVIYGRTPAEAVRSGVIYYTWILPALTALIVWKLRKSSPWLACAALVFVVALLPISGLARFMFQIHSTVADHYMYLPMLGPVIALAWLLAHRPTRVVYTIVILILVTFSLMSIVQLGHWRDSVALFRHAIAINPRSATAYSNLGVALASAGHVDQAVPYFEKAVQISPMNRLAHTNLARAYLEYGDNARAAYHARMALSIAYRQPLELRGDTAWEEFMLQQATQRMTQPATTTTNETR